jgi:hypothetical protein
MGSIYFIRFSITFRYHGKIFRVSGVRRHTAIREESVHIYRICGRFHQYRIFLIAHVFDDLLQTGWFGTHFHGMYLLSGVVHDTGASILFMYV